MNATFTFTFSPREAIPTEPEARIAWLERHGAPPAGEVPVTATADLRAWHAAGAEITAGGEVKLPEGYNGWHRTAHKTLEVLVDAAKRLYAETGEVVTALPTPIVDAVLTARASALAAARAAEAEDREASDRAHEVKKQQEARERAEAEARKAAEAEAKERLRAEVRAAYLAFAESVGEPTARAAREGYPVAQAIADNVKEQLCAALGEPVEEMGYSNVDEIKANRGDVGTDDDNTSWALRASPSAEAFAFYDKVVQAVANLRLPSTGVAVMHTKIIKATRVVQVEDEYEEESEQKTHTTGVLVRIAVIRPADIGSTRDSIVTTLLFSCER